MLGGSGGWHGGSVVVVPGARTQMCSVQKKKRQDDIEVQSKSSTCLVSKSRCYFISTWQMPFLGTMRAA
jgi:hypothetical protein